MRSIAIYNIKGGVGKTTLAVNLAWCAASLSSRRTLLWDLDAQAASTFILGNSDAPADEARAVFARELDPADAIRPTTTPRLDLLPADASLRDLDQFFFGLRKKRRLGKLLEFLDRDYDRVVLDCPPGLTETSEQVLRAADIIIVPVVPSPLSQRAMNEVVAYLDREGGRRAPILPVFNMVDRRRAMHVDALAGEPKWPVVPMASAVETMAVRHAAVGDFAPRSPAAEAIGSLWVAIERKLARLKSA